MEFEALLKNKLNKKCVNALGLLIKYKNKYSVLLFQCVFIE